VTTATGAKKILWVDDEIELLRPHFLFLRQRGYHVDAISPEEMTVPVAMLRPKSR